MLQKRKHPPILLALMLFASIGPMSVSIAHPENSSSKKVAENTHQCAWCNKSFNHMSVLTRHIKTHTGEKPYKCRLCSYSAAQKVSLTRHIKTHTGEKTYKCTFSGCRYSAAEKSHLTRHKRTHTGEKPYKCRLCSYSAAHKGSLTRHIKTHTGEKTYKCTFSGCKYSAAEKNTLTKHTRTHTGEKPYKCRFFGCRYSTAEKSSLTKHTRTHTGEKPYKCTFSGCSYSAARKISLTSHTRTHHPIITPEQSTSTNPLPSNQLARVTAALGVSTEMPASRTKRTSALRKRPATRENQPADSKKARVSALLLRQSMFKSCTAEDNFLAEPNLLKRSFASFKPTAQPNDWDPIEFFQEDPVEDQKPLSPTGAMLFSTTYRSTAESGLSDTLENQTVIELLPEISEDNWMLHGPSLRGLFNARI